MRVSIPNLLALCAACTSNSVLQANAGIRSTKTPAGAAGSNPGRRSTLSNLLNARPAEQTPTFGGDVGSQGAGVSFRNTHDGGFPGAVVSVVAFGSTESQDEPTPTSRSRDAGPPGRGDVYFRNAREEGFPAAVGADAAFANFDEPGEPFLVALADGDGAGGGAPLKADGHEGPKVDALADDQDDPDVDASARVEVRGLSTVQGGNCDDNPSFPDFATLASEVDAYHADSNCGKGGNGTGCSVKNFGYPMNTWCTKDITTFTEWPSFQGLFSYSRVHALESFNEPINGWDTSSVTSFFNVFQSAHKFNQPLDGWSVSKVTIFDNAFQHAYKFNQPIGGWDVSNAVDFTQMFYNAQAFNQDINSWNTSSLTSLQGAFPGAWAFNQPLNEWDVSSVKDMYSLFADAREFNQPLWKWNLTSVTSAPSAFNSASKFNQDLCTWGQYYKDTISMNRYFYGTSCPGGNGGTDQAGKDGVQSADGPWCQSTSQADCPNLFPEAYGITVNPPTDGPTGGPTSGPTSNPTTSGPTGAPTTNMPTDAPTTHGPTESPTTDEPTGAPTTNAPTSTPWTIDFLDVVSDFTAQSEEEIVLKYEIGKNRTFETFLYQKDCATNITGVAVNTTRVETNINATHDLLILSNSLDKSAIANSSIWNDTSSKIEICQVVNLIVPAASSQPKIVVVEDIRQVDIDFDLSVDYSVASDLGAGTTEEVADSTNVSSYLSACKCPGPNDFGCNASALVPNTQLYVCIKSVSTDVEIDELVSMEVSQGTSSLAVVEDGDVKISSITDVTYVPDQNGVVVATFVPTNMFNYSAGASVNITGAIDMKLADSTRRLARLDDGAYGDNGNGQASYQVKVDLQDEVIVLGEGAWMDSPGPAVTCKASSALLGMAFLLAISKW